MSHRSIKCQDVRVRGRTCDSAFHAPCDSLLFQQGAINDHRTGVIMSALDAVRFGVDVWSRRHFDMAKLVGLLLSAKLVP